MLHSLSRVSNSPSYHPRNEEFPHEQVVSYYAIYPSHHHLLRSSDVPLDVSICYYTVVKFVLEMYSSSEVHERSWLWFRERRRRSNWRVLMIAIRLPWRSRFRHSWESHRLLLGAPRRLQLFIQNVSRKGGRVYERWGGWNLVPLDVWSIFFEYSQ